MKWFRYFENIEEKWYNIVDYNYYSEKVYNDYHIPVDKNWMYWKPQEVEELKKFFNGIEFRYYIDGNIQCVKYKPETNKIQIRHKNWSISKINDEWFYVSSLIDYKCDQFDGLMQCLNDLRKRGKL